VHETLSSCANILTTVQEMPAPDAVSSELDIPTAALTVEQIEPLNEMETLAIENSPTTTVNSPEEILGMDIDFQIPEQRSPVQLAICPANDDFVSAVDLEELNKQETNEGGCIPPKPPLALQNKWVVGRSIPEMMKYVLENDEGTLKDVTFLVGPNRERISAHKVILAVTSPVFQKILHSLQMLRDNDRMLYISAPDLQPDAFRSLLRVSYIYNSLSGGDILVMSISFV
jgi:hypothetical protein